MISPEVKDRWEFAKLNSHFAYYRVYLCFVKVAASTCFPEVGIPFILPAGLADFNLCVYYPEKSWEHLIPYSDLSLVLNGRSTKEIGSVVRLNKGQAKRKGLIEAWQNDLANTVDSMWIQKSACYCEDHFTVALTEVALALLSLAGIWRSL